MSDVTALLINTRGNPDLLTTTVIALLRLAKRPLDLRFCVRVDQDDLPTFDAINRLRKYCNLSYVIGGRPKSLGAELNRFCHNVKADFYHVINDDVIPLTPNWDEPQVKRRDGMLEKGKTPAFVGCWLLPEIPGGGMCTPDYPIVTRQWLDAAPGGDIFTNYFPFWFDDRWLQEVSMLIHGKTVQPLPIALSARKNLTQRMRDVTFWFNFYLSLQDERIAQAQEIADKIGVKVDIRKDRVGMIEFMRNMHTRDRDKFDETHGRFKDKSDPDPFYLESKKEAEHILRAMGGEEAVARANAVQEVKGSGGEDVDKAA